MQVHGSCAARDGHGVLLVGTPGSGKSDLVLRLLDHGFTLVADDRVDIRDGMAAAPLALAGLLEIRGLGIVRLPYLMQARLTLVISLGRGDRLPEPACDPLLALPQISIDPAMPSAPARVRAALDCALGGMPLLAGAFA